MADMIEFRDSPNLLFSAKQKYIFAIAGIRAPGKVERYNIILDQWQKMPKLNMERQRCSSCLVNDESMIYVISGESTKNNMLLDSIERLDITKERYDYRGFW